MTTSPTLRDLIAAFDWSATAFGPRGNWAPGVRSVVDLVMSSASPMLLLWGEALVLLYNDPFAALLGRRHPAALGQPVHEVWPEFWAMLEPLMSSVQRGETAASENVGFHLMRRGFEEEAYFTLSHTPVRDSSGTVAGVFVSAADTTAQVVSVRRTTVQNALAARLAPATTFTEVQQRLRGSSSVPDVPFVELYPVGDDLPPALAEVVRTGQTALLDWTVGGPSRPALALWLDGREDGQAGGVLVLGLNPQLAADEAQVQFLHSVAAQVSAALLRVHALEQAELNRQLAQEREALAAFAQFTEAVGRETDIAALMRQAIALLRELLGVEASYFEREGELYIIRLWPSDFPPELLARSREGFTLDFPDIARAARERRLVFVDHYNEPLRGVAESAMYGAVAYQPFFQDEVMSAVLVMGSRHTSHWSERERGVFRAVGRSLTLAVERAVVVSQLSAERRRLQAANEELEAFTYSVSHDLRTPVRHIQGFAGLLRHSLDGGIDPKASYYLNVLDEATVRMNTLIDAMLALARTSRQPLHPSPLDLAELVEQLRAELLPEQQDRAVEWHIGPLPPLVADRNTLHQALLNLLSNALKYTRTREQAEITVWGEERPGGWTVLVQDNGVGFDPRYASKLFGVFQRLHRQEEFEGTGVGLANVRRIIERHGGTVFAESTIGQGATFGFTLPRP